MAKYLPTYNLSRFMPCPRQRCIGEKFFKKTAKKQQQQRGAKKLGKYQFFNRKIPGIVKKIQKAPKIIEAKFL